MVPITEQPVLVLGGTRKTGRRVLQRLAARGVATRIGSRAGTPRFDWEDRSTWAPALNGVGSVYLTYYPDLAVPGAAAAVRSFAELAVRTGVRRLALLSGRGELRLLAGELPTPFLDADDIAEASGREVRYVPVTLEEHAAEAAAHGVPPEVIELLTYLFSEVMDGRNATTTDGVRRALGRDPQDFGRYARNAAATGVWNGSAAAA